MQLQLQRDDGTVPDTDDSLESFLGIRRTGGRCAKRLARVGKAGTNGGRGKGRREDTGDGIRKRAWSTVETDGKDNSKTIGIVPMLLRLLRLLRNALL